MRVSRFGSLVVLALAAITVPTPAQIASSIEARAEMSSAGTASEDVSILAAALRMDRPRLSLSWDAEVANDADRWRGSGQIGGVVRAPAYGPLQLSFASALSNPYRTGIDRHSELVGAARASLRWGAAGLWAGVNVRRVLGGPSSGSTPALGAWRQFGPAVVTVQLAAHRVKSGETPGVRTVPRRDSIFNDSLGRWQTIDRLVDVPDSTGSLHPASWSDAEARLLWTHRGLTLDATLGARFAASGLDQTMWAQLRGVYAISTRFALIAGAASEPADPLLGWERRSSATLGVRVLDVAAPKLRPPAEVRPTPAAFQLLAVRGERHLIRVRAPHAYTVEISADFTEWQPVALTRASPDWWQANVDIPAGTHHVNVRVNGDRWTAPPGLPAVKDEFNGTVGLLVVE
jgi:hypothetical protein